MLSGADRANLGNSPDFLIFLANRHVFRSF